MQHIKCLARKFGLRKHFVFRYFSKVKSVGQFICCLSNSQDLVLQPCEVMPQLYNVN